jgi:hypothetical protein
MSMGTVGTMMEQKMAMHMPSRKDGIHLTNSLLLSVSVAYATIMKRYVKVKNPQEAMRA